MKPPPMVEAPSRLAGPSEAWRTAALSAVFVLDITQISRAGGDLLEPLLLTAILQANQATVLADPALQLRYASAAEAAPDALRRPISINALSQSLGLPFETVRRRVRRLEARGLCVSTERGVYVPEAAVGSAGYLQVLIRRAERLAQLRRDLAAAGLPAGPPELEGFLGHAARAADRLLANYMLRICGDLVALTGGAVDGLVLLGLFAQNLRDQHPALLRGPADFLAMARPVSGFRLAQVVGLPGETARRHLAALSERGLCRRAGQGWVAEAPRPAVERLVAENLRNVTRLLAGLAELAGRNASDDRVAG